MTEIESAQATRPISQAPTVLEFGGLRFDVAFRTGGATLRVDGPVNGIWTHMLRFDDFVDAPHFHVPSDAPQTLFDRASLGEPLAWYVAQIKDNLREWIDKAGFSEVLSDIDFETISSNAERLTEAMIACVPEGFVRVPGIGLQRVEASA